MATTDQADQTKEWEDFCEKHKNLDHKTREKLWEEEQTEDLAAQYAKMLPNLAPASVAGSGCELHAQPTLQQVQKQEVQWERPKCLQDIDHKMLKEAKECSATLESIKPFLELNRPSVVSGRENEFNAILEFCHKAITSPASSSNHPKVPKGLYICGKPGVGKTAVVMTVCAYLSEQKNATILGGNKPKILSLKGTSLLDPKEIYYKLADFAAQVKKKSEYTRAATAQDARRDMQKMLHREHRNAKMAVVVVDEIDQLFSRNQEVLYELFQEASRPESRMVLIGMANSLNMVDNLLPKLRETDAEPAKITFDPYDKMDVVRIIQSRVPQHHFFDEKAIELCARKLATDAGDIRKALEICRMALDIAAEEKDNKVMTKHMFKAVSKLMGSPYKKFIEDLSQTQKYVLIALSKLSGDTEVRRHITFDRAKEVCRLFFRKHKLGNGANGNLRWEDVKEAIDILESNGLIKVQNKNSQMSSTLVLNLGFEDIFSALQKTSHFESLLEAPLELPEAREAIAAADL